MEDETSVQVAEAIADLTEQAQKDAALQADTQQMVGQSQTLKQKSMVHSGGVELPARVKFYRSYGGDEVWLPTVQLAHHLAKRHTDGTPVFVRERPGPEPTPIDRTCPPCLDRGVRKKFYHEYGYLSHMESKHPRYYRMMQMEEKSVSGGDVAAALMNMSEQERDAIKVLLGGTSNGREQGEEKAHCDACGWEGKPVKNVAASLGAHQRFRCSARAGVATGSGTAD